MQLISYRLYEIFGSFYWRLETPFKFIKMILLKYQDKISNR